MMTIPARATLASLLCAAASACGGGSAAPAVDAAPIGPTANEARDVTATALAFDVTALTGSASITLAPSTTDGATLEVGNLTIDTVQVGGVDLAYATIATPSPSAPLTAIALALPASDQPTQVDVNYHYKHNEDFTGASIGGYTLIWPYYCGNVFPCHSAPADGTTFTLSLAGVPDGSVAVYPPAITSDAPSYQIAWSIDSYTQLDLGTTTAGTLVSAWYLPNELADAQAGLKDSVAAFDWFEKTLGPYRFGNHIGAVSVRWPNGDIGGMEHHPFWHEARQALSDIDTNVHESAHGWFGDGIRIGCWEDFVLSEGTVVYLTGRALDVVDPAEGSADWASNATLLSQLTGTEAVYPSTCGAVDIIKDNLFTNAPYYRGAFFYRGIAQKLGADVLDGVLAAFYAKYAGQSAHMSDMLALIQQMTGYDPTACAQTWFYDTTLPTPGPCP